MEQSTIDTVKIFVQKLQYYMGEQGEKFLNARRVYTVKSREFQHIKEIGLILPYFTGSDLESLEDQEVLQKVDFYTARYRLTDYPIISFPSLTTILRFGDGILSSYTDADARQAISLTTLGTSGAASYNTLTGVLNIPNYEPGVSTSTTLTINGTTNQINISGGVQDLSTSRIWTASLSDNPIIPGTASLTLPIGTTAQEPTASNGMLRYNSTTNKLMGVEGSTWKNLITAAPGITIGENEIAYGNADGDITSSFNLTFDGTSFIVNDIIFEGNTFGYEPNFNDPNPSFVTILADAFRWTSLTPSIELYESDQGINHFRLALNGGNLEFRDMLDGGGLNASLDISTGIWNYQGNNLNNIGQLNVDNLRLDGNTISSTDVNGNINISPNGTGKATFSGYGSGSKTGTATKLLAVDASGNIIEEDAPSGTSIASNEIAFGTGTDITSSQGLTFVENQGLTIKDITALNVGIVIDGNAVNPEILAKSQTDLGSAGGTFRFRTRTYLNSSYANRTLFEWYNHNKLIAAISNSSQLNLFNGGGLQLFNLNNTASIQITHNGTDANLDFTNTTDLNINDGVNVKIFDSSNTDYIQISHDGTDANIDFSGTTALNINNANVEAGTSSGPSFLVVRDGTIADSESRQIQVYATHNAASRRGSLGVYTHAGITNAAAYFALQQENGTTVFLWSDNSSDFRISTVPDHIGTTSGTIVGTQTSDSRLKDATSFNYGLTEILQVEPIAFTFKNDVESTPRLGFSAQQVLPIIPEAVYDTKEYIDGTENTKLGMDYSSLIPVLVQAIKELNNKISILENK